MGGHRKTVAEGRFVIPSGWPAWRKKCGVNKRRGGICGKWAVVGMPTCKFHGSGGEKNAQLGQLRYLAWVITGGPQNMPVEAACQVAFAVFAEAILKRSEGSIEQRMRAAMWLTNLLDAQ